MKRTTAILALMALALSACQGISASGTESGGYDDAARRGQGQWQPVPGSPNPRLDPGGL
jgi:hypothetical protein